MTVRARQKLKSPEAAQKFNDELLAKIQGHVDKGVTPSFEDFDISQNPMPFDQLDAMFNTFQTTGVRIERVRMFGCATLDDNAMLLLAEWLRNVTAETAPHELHLSDCAITQDGFNQLVEAVESNDSFPTPDRTGRRCPLYVRLENNYIQPESAIQDKINEGVIVTYQKNSGPIRGPISSAPDAKIKLVAPAKQRQGAPPAPEDAAAPKPVFDRYYEEQQQKGQGKMEQQKGQGKGKGIDGKGAPGSGYAQAQPTQSWGWQSQYGARPQYGMGGQAPTQSWGSQAHPAPSWGQSHPAPSWGALPQYGAQPQYGKGAQLAAQQQPQRPQQQSNVKPVGTYQAPAAKAAGAYQAPGAKVAGPFKASSEQTGKGAGKLSSTMPRAADRSRTPAPKPAAAKPKMASDWEEHFSDEYKIPYWWNKITGESVWEKPMA